MCDCVSLEIPGCNQCIHPGDQVRLHRFDSEPWVVGFGWYTWGGNRPVCGWYLTSCIDTKRLKPLQKPDLDDIYFVQS